MTVPPVQTDVNIGMSSTEKPDKYISYNMSTKTVTITSNVAYSNAAILVATYNNQKLVDLKLKKANIKNGNTDIAFNEISYDSADTIKIFAWENEKSMKPICRSYVKRISQ